MYEYLPKALLYGVPYDLFWHLNPAKLKPFRMAYQEKLDTDNYNAWMHGIYVKAAICSAIQGKSAKYPDKPFGSQEEAQECTEQSAEIAAKKFEEWTKVFNSKLEQQER